MVYSLEEIGSRITPVAQKYKIPCVFVFGSYARGEATSKSDVDLLYVDSGTVPQGLAFGDFCIDMRKALKKRVDLVSIQSLERSADSIDGRAFYDEVTRERQVVYAEP